MLEARIAPGLAILSSRPKTSFLISICLEHRLDDQVAIGQRFEVERRLQQPHRAFDLFRGHAALGCGRFIVLAHHTGAAVERFLRHFDDGHRDSGRQEVHRNAAAHRAGADYADLLDRTRPGVLGDILDLRRLALGEEEILLRLGLGPGHQPHEQVALVDDPFGIGFGDRRLDRLDVGLGRLEPAEFARVGLAEFIEDRRIGTCFGQLLVPFRRFGQRADVLDLVRQRDRVLEQFALCNPVDQANSKSLSRANGGARRDHLERLLDPGDARQALRPARTWQQAELHFWNS